MTMKKSMIAAALSTVALSACTSIPAETQPAFAEVQILAINDFHGNLETPQRAERYLDDGTERSARLGGVAQLGAVLESLRGAHSVTVAAGDLIGASPLISALFLDEPTIAALSAIGLDIASVGNHEFDRGIAELQRMQIGGCEQNTRRQPCAVEPFAGAGFTYLSANVVDTEAQTLFPALAIRQIDGAAVAFVGMTLEGTPNLVAEQATEGYSFLDEAMTANMLVPYLREQGVDIAVLLIHEGANVRPSFNTGDCPDVSGPAVEIAGALDPAYALVVSGHTHQAYICVIAREGDAPIMLTSGGRYGAFVTDITMRIDTVNDGVVAIAARNVPVVQEAGSHPEADAIVRRYAEAVGPVANRAVGRIAPAAAHDTADCLDQPAQGFTADAHLFAARALDADFALVNSGGVRTDLSGANDGVLAYGELAAMQPFNNGLIVLEMTGAAIDAVLEAQFCEEDGRVAICQSSLIPSANLSYRVALSKGEDRVSDIVLDGAPLDPARTYRIVVNSFLAGGGDGFAAFTAAPRIGNAGFDIDAVEAYVASGDTQVPACGRIRNAIQR